MKAAELETDNALLRLVEPSAERDASLSVQWLTGELGHTTLLLMGNSAEAVREMLPTSLEKETKRIEDFLERRDQLNWMIEHEGKVVGSVWVDLEDSEELPSPSVHIMIGDPAMRGKGIGHSTIKAVLNHLEGEGHGIIYTRHTTSNERADELLKSSGFEDLGSPYTKDGVEYQNLVLHTNTK
jgi:RimJ/RimL family protein N-acetyltransferase